MLYSCFGLDKICYICIRMIWMNTSAFSGAKKQIATNSINCRNFGCCTVQTISLLSHCPRNALIETLFLGQNTL